MNVVWLPVVGFEDFYEVSDLGTVRSLGGRRGSSRRLLKQCDFNGYRRVTLSANGKRRDALVHRLVAEAFIPNPRKLPHVNHLDGAKDNNEPLNLEWTDHQGNMTHAWSSGLINHAGEKHTQHKLTEAQAQAIKSHDHRTDALAHALAAEYGVSDTAIYDIWAGRTWAKLAKANLIPIEEGKTDA